MGFKLTILLLAAMFAVMWFAGAPDPDQPARTTEPTVAINPPDPAPAPAAQPDAPVRPPTVAQAEAQQDETDTSFGTATDLESDAPEEEDTAPGLSALTLQRLQLDTDNASAVSLADRVRERLDAGTANPAPAPNRSASTDAATSLAEVTADSVNLRAGPTTAEPVMGRVSAGQRVEVLEDMPSGWSRIRHPETGGEVYMSTNFLRRIDR